MENLDNIALENFKEYLQIPSVHPDIDYSDCVKFLTKIAEDLQLPIRVINVTPKNPVVVLTWKGTNPELPTILLNSHMDVVEVSEKDWKHKPFGAEIEDGKIYARGAQDMKSVGIQYLEAIRRMKLQNITCLRTVHVCFVPEEEVGKEGMELFVHTAEFKEMNVGLCMDESYANETEKFIFVYGEKSCWQFTIHCKGQSGHGSIFSDNTPGEQLALILEKVYDFRKEQKEKIQNELIEVGETVSVNCTKVSGGEQYNVVPNEMTATFDMRIPPTYSFEEIEEMINKWCKEAGPDCFVEYHDKQNPTPDTKLDDSNIFWRAFREASEELNLELDIVRCIATSDSRYIRLLGIPSFGFSPMNNTKPLMHANDEYLGVETFLNGIKIFCGIIPKLANVH
ncbi:hypothetical protein WA026_005690 [Henosepilachna vigintioctopunctata]|uniref:N-acyl-aliphatic-L-amino acid amidohydrolase n=1 Tax=Henosepilachna vigintioctopunctata TaxID=420089 RepID=A0AAW1U4Q9_9CUCU